MGRIYFLIVFITTIFFPPPLSLSPLSLSLPFRCAFLHFCGEKRPKLKVENPNANIGELSKRLSDAWKVMNLEQKQPYQDMAMRDKVRWAWHTKETGGSPHRLHCPITSEYRLFCNLIGRFDTDCYGNTFPSLFLISLLVSLSLSL